MTLQSWLLTLPTNVGLDRKAQKTFALFVLSIDDKEKMCVTIETGVSVLNTLSVVPDLTDR
jgi:hypothetical protein